MNVQKNNLSNVENNQNVVNIATSISKSQAEILELENINENCTTAEAVASNKNDVETIENGIENNSGDLAEYCEINKLTEMISDNTANSSKQITIENYKTTLSTYTPIADEDQNSSINRISSQTEDTSSIVKVSESSNHNFSTTVDDNLISIDDGTVKDNLITYTTIKKRRTRNIIDSDDESSDKSIQENNQEEVNEKIIGRYKKQNIFDSDSENEVLSNNLVNTSIEAPIYSVDDKGNVIKESDNQSRFLAICDPDDSDSELNLSAEETYPDQRIHKNKKKYRSKKSKPISEKDVQPKQLTGRDAAKLKKEIQSESQRMTRESTINLPYHKPKARTLKEFLQNRSCFATTLPPISCKTPPSLALKMSTDQLKAISEKISAREREIKRFFKSNSDSEEEHNPTKLNTTYSKQKKILENDALEELTETSSACIPTNINSSVDDNLIKDNFLEESKQLLQNSNNILDKRDLVAMIDTNKKKSVSNDSNTTKLDETLDTISQEVTSTEIQSISHNIDDFTTMAAEINENKANKVVNTLTNNPKLNQICSPEFQFNLTGIDFDEDESQDAVAMEDKINKLIEKYTTDEVVNKTTSESAANTESVNKHNSIIEKPKANSILDLVKEKLGNFKPQLHGSHDHIIDLDDDTTQVNEINQLMNRFVKHNKKISPQKHKVKLDVVSLSDGKVHKETVEMSVNGEETIPVTEKPGERLKRLRDELQTQMAQKRSEIWQRRTNLKASNKEEEKEEKSDCNEIENDVLDTEYEEEFTESEEEEDVIEDCEKNEEQKTSQKCDFLDEEAEESDDDNNDIDNMLEENYQKDETSNEENEESQDSFKTRKKKKLLKRIIKPFSNESEDEESSVNSDVSSILERNNSKLSDPHDNEDNHLDSTSTWEECCILTPNQPKKSQTPIRKETQSKSELGFLTPVIQLTGLQSLNSGSKFLHESPISPFVMPPDSSPTKSQTQSGPQKRLFADIDLASTQELSEVAELCSGVFPSQSQELENESESKDICKSTPVRNNVIISENTTFNLDAPSTQDLLEICSGKFTGVTQAITNVETKDNRIKDCENTANNNCTLINTVNQKLIETSTTNTEIKNLDAEDKLISELLNEEEMENFKQRFESPTDNDTSEVPFGRVIYDSSDEEISNKMKNKTRKLIFSDDEDDSDKNENSDEEIDLCDRLSEDEGSNSNVQNVEYDSEENEIELDMKDKPTKMKITDFLENEAELSESEWGSADEDERGLDELELEEGDNEKLDTEQVKRDLERIHMRRVLDDDNHEVKILQELLLDDGEMYGSGRERQFRWKNIDVLGNELENTKPDDGEVYLDEDDDEEKWRKMRYEREVFLKKQLDRSQSLDIEETIVTKTNSQILKLGQKAIKRSISASQNENTAMEEEKTISAKLLTTSLASKRGSFLTRSDQVLQRVAEFTKTLNIDVGSTKNSKKFIFNVVSEPTNSVDKKRKASDGTPTAIKKLRLDHLSPSVQNKKGIFNKLNF